MLLLIPLQSSICLLPTVTSRQQTWPTGCVKRSITRVARSRFHMEFAEHTDASRAVEEGPLGLSVVAEQNGVRVAESSGDVAPPRRERRHLEIRAFRAFRRWTGQ